MIKVWAVELTNVEEQTTTDRVFFGNHAQANRYAHNKAKASPYGVTRVIELEAEILQEKQLAFYMQNGRFSLNKGGMTP
jgi:hypothetical protein